MTSDEKKNQESSDPQLTEEPRPQPDQEPESFRGAAKVLVFVFELSMLPAAWLICALRGISPATMFGSTVPPLPQVGYGVAAGLVAGLIALALVLKIDAFSGVLKLIRDVQESVGLSHLQWAGLSLAAALGEETLFRGAIQPVLGIALTSLLFILLHGYLTSGEKGMRLMGVILFGLSCLLGWFYREMGMIAAISCHFIYDLTLTTGLMLTGIISDPDDQENS